MEELEQIFQTYLEKVDGDTLLATYALREAFRHCHGFNQSCNAGIFNGMMNSQPDKLGRINSLLNSLSNDEHSQLWQFILEQTKDFRDRIPDEHKGNVELLLAKLDTMEDLREI
jgi:hypothetical protein